MSDYVNRVTLNVARNGTTTHTVNPASTGVVVSGTAFTPTAGRFLLCIVDASVTSTTPAGWTLPTNGSAINQTGLYVFTKTAAGSDTITTTHNASNYPMHVTFLEFPASSTFVKAATATAVSLSGVNPTISALTGTNWLGAVKAVSVGSGNTETGATWSGATEVVDTVVSFATTDGYGITIAETNASTATSFAPTATITGTGLIDCEALTFAVNVPSGGNTGTLSAPVPVVTSSIAGTQTNLADITDNVPLVTTTITGTQTNVGVLADSLPVLTTTLAGSQTNPAVLNATLTDLTASITGTATNAGTLSAALPVLTTTATGTQTNLAALSAAVPRLTTSMSEQLGNPGTLNAALPLLTTVLTGTLTNPAALAAAVPTLTGSVTGTMTNQAALNAAVPRLTTSIAEAGSVNVAVLNASIPRLTGSLAGNSVNAGALTATLPVVSTAIPGTLKNTAVLTATLPRISSTLTAVSVNAALLLAVLPLLRFSADDGVRRDITVTALLEPRRWASTLTARSKYGTMNDRRWKGGLS